MTITRDEFIQQNCGTDWQCSVSKTKEDNLFNCIIVAHNDDILWVTGSRLSTSYYQSFMISDC
jgi:hypothetical protein